MQKINKSQSIISIFNIDDKENNENIKVEVLNESKNLLKTRLLFNFSNTYNNKINNKKKRDI